LLEIGGNTGELAPVTAPLVQQSPET